LTFIIDIGLWLCYVGYMKEKIGIKLKKLWKGQLSPVEQILFCVLIIFGFFFLVKVVFNLLDWEMYLP